MANEAKNHLDRIVEVLRAYSGRNNTLAIDEPANDFERSVNELHDLQALIAEIKAAMKPAEAIERKQRDAIAESLDEYFGDQLKEGVNTYELSNGRKLKYTATKSRAIDTPQIAIARKAFEADADGVPVALTFDSLLRVKYELDKKAFNELSKYPSVTSAISRMIITKAAACKIEVD